MGVLLATAAASCALDRPYVWVQDMPSAPAGPALIEPRDTILVVVRNQPPLSGEFVVSEQGEYSQPTLGAVRVAGKTPETVASELVVMFKDILVKPDVAVTIVKQAPIRVNVVGEVKAPGSYELTRNRGVIPALAAAGWLTEFANRDRIFLIRAGSVGAPRIRFRAGELTSAEPHAAAYRLNDGDIVVVE